jgi:plasmid stabilization system protein ParE
MQLKDIYDYIYQASPQGARKVRHEIFATIKKLPLNPEIFPADVLKVGNDGSYRVFYIYSYRIVYKITADDILILRIRHTSREPEQY